MPESKISFSEPVIETESIEVLSKKLLSTTAQLLEANAELTRLQNERAEMLANLSHDLRAPITAIRSSIDYLTSDQTLTPEDTQNALQLIHRRTATLEDLIQDMYYLFCVEDRSREFSFEPIDIFSFLESYYYDLFLDSKFDGYELSLDLEENASCLLQIDPPKLVRVFDNLLSNAVKYTPKGTKISISAYLQPQDTPSATPAQTSSQDTESFFCIKIKDNGPGIPRELVPHIFKRTYTVSSARTPGLDSGSGLGLAIVQAILERHGGAITCKSALGEGCEFTIMLPLANIIR